MTPKYLRFAAALVFAAPLLHMVGCQKSSPDESYAKMLSSSVSTAYPDLMEHFPASVPLNARLTRVSHSSGWGTRWAARFEGADAGYLDALRRRYPPNAEAEDAGEYCWYWLAPALDISGKPGDYATVALKTRSGNHGHRAGVSISKQGRDALFWAERW